jgi:FkbM family methyltransferase
MDTESKPVTQFIIDVGANEGAFAIEIAIANPECIVIAIEAIPELCKIIAEKALRQNLKNIRIINKAVSLRAGTSAFFISKKGDMGTSSLRPFSRENINGNAYWSNRMDLEHEEEITVEMVTLEEVVSGEGIEEICFLKIDAQGADVEVLMSLGGQINKVRAGVLESSSTKGGALYGSGIPDLRETLNVLVENGFNIEGIHSNDPFGNEYNIHFNDCRIGFNQIARKLSLDQIRSYSGKLFWHLPSNQLKDYETELHDLKTQLHSARTKLHLVHSQIHQSISSIIELKSQLDGLGAKLDQI